MIQITDKTKCCGCGVCKEICPQNAIKMLPDEEGFLYPYVDINKCNDCGLCEKKCIILNKIKLDDNSNEAYAVYNKDNEIRRKSTSGGFFSAISEKIIDLNGVVFGAVFDQDFNVMHIGIEKKEDLYKFRGSKYVQSKVNQNYKLIKELLRSDRYVLFSGTPCQIYGLKAFLGKEYNKLYCIDILCKGVPSPKLWSKYLDYKKTKGEIKSINFREKTYGFNSTTMTIRYENGKVYKKGHESDEMLRLFVNEFSSRTSCYDCNFKGLQRYSDFSIGDFWKVDEMIREIDKEKGTNLVIIHTKKAEEFIKNIDTIFFIEVDIKKALDLNGGNKKSMYLESAKPNKYRNEFFKDLNELEYSKLIKKYCPVTFKCYIKSKLKPLLYKTGLLNNAKKLFK